MLSGVISGLLAGAVALGVAELIAGLTGPAGSPVVAVGGAAIDMTPIPVKDRPAGLAPDSVGSPSAGTYGQSFGSYLTVSLPAGESLPVSRAS